MPSGKKLPTRLAGRLERSPERPKSPDSGVQLSISADEKREIEEITIDQTEKAPASGKPKERTPEPGPKMKKIPKISPKPKTSTSSRRSTKDYPIYFILLVKKNPTDKDEKFDFKQIRKLVTKWAANPKVEFVSERRRNEFVVELALHKSFAITHMTKMWEDQSEFLTTEHLNTIEHAQQKQAARQNSK